MSSKSKESSRSRRLASLDGLRAFAVALVVAAHSTYRFDGGGIGVCIFFVLSGYLITGLLMHERERLGTIALRLFSARRLLRLYPALILVLVVCVVIFGSPVRSALIAGTYTTNLFDVFSTHSAEPFGHTWSLAAEEQFYLIWPLVVLLLAGRRKLMLSGLTALTVASVVACWWGTRQLIARHESMNAVFNPLWQGHGLLIGCILALVLAVRPAVARPNLLVGAGFVAELVIAMGETKTTHHNLSAFWNVASEIVAAFMIAGLRQSGDLSGISRIFTNKVSAWIGYRSYAIYLWHYPLIVIAVGKGMNVTKAALIWVPVAIIAAEVSGRWVEAPFMRIKDRLHPAPPGRHSVKLETEAIT